MYIMSIGLSEDEIALMFKEEMKALDEYQKEVKHSNNRLLKVIKKVKGRSFCENLKSYMEDLEGDCGHYMNPLKWGLTRSTTGQYQKEYGYGREIKGIWCDQWIVGDSGDSYAGIIYIELTPNRYLCVNYSM